MTYHILNGDALTHSFHQANIPGEIIVFREALIDGDLSGSSLQDFWKNRAEHHGATTSGYYDKVVTELEKITNASGNSEFNLWFEYDLFCQVNMWFVISIIDSLPIEKKVFAVHTSHLDKTSKEFWNGFGQANSDDLNVCFANRTAFTDEDLELGQALWTAFKNHDFKGMEVLSRHQSRAFPYLQPVVKAQIDRFPADGAQGRPENVIENILKDGTTDFSEVFREFWNRESIYGFGDTQLKSLYDKVIRRYQ